MPRLIDADEFERRCMFSKEVHKEVDEDGLYAILEELRMTPTVDAEPVRRGHWELLLKTHEVVEDGDYYWGCSECNHVDCHNINVEVPYCWHCGAKMDEVEDAEIH